MSKGKWTQAAEAVASDTTEASCRDKAVALYPLRALAVKGISLYRSASLGCGDVAFIVAVYVDRHAVPPYSSQILVTLALKEPVFCAV